MPRERTFIMIKPDGVQRGLVAKIITRFEEKGFKLVSALLARMACAPSRTRRLPFFPEARLPPGRARACPPVARPGRCKRTTVRLPVRSRAGGHCAWCAGGTSTS